MHTEIDQIKKMTGWSSAIPEKRSLLSGQIDIWYTHLTRDWEQALLNQYKALCSEEEKVQQNRFFRKEDQQNYLVSRGLLRWALAQYLENITSKDIFFYKGIYGKPFIGNFMDTALQFSLSHTKDLVVLAVILEQNIGVDIEPLERDIDIFNIAESFFSPLEYKELCSLSPEQLKPAFVKIWTLKEAYLKACGTGLTTPLDQFCFSFPKNEIKISFKHSDKNEPYLWQFYNLNFAHEHLLSLAVKNNHNKAYRISACEAIPMSCFRKVNLSDFNNFSTDHIN